MPRPTRRQVPKVARRSRGTQGSHVGQPDDFLTMQTQSLARQFARKDRAQRPLHCHTSGKLMYDTEEIAKSTAEALQRLRHEQYSAYRCPVGRHFHLTTWVAKS